MRIAALCTVLALLLSPAAYAEEAAQSAKEGFKDLHKGMKKVTRSVHTQAKKDTRKIDKEARKGWNKAGKDIREAAKE